VRFLPIPKSYYADVPERIGEMSQDVADLQRLGILVDRDEEGYLGCRILHPRRRRSPDGVLRADRAPRAPAASARGTSRPYSKPWSASRNKRGNL